MTAPIVWHETRRPRIAYLAPARLHYSHLWHQLVAVTPGLLWERVAEGRKQVWS
jgi:hypothetical protein